jgi:hypothetical protein
MSVLDKKVHGPEFFQNLAPEESDLMQNAKGNFEKANACIFMRLVAAALLR